MIFRKGLIRGVLALLAVVAAQATGAGAPDDWEFASRLHDSARAPASSGLPDRVTLTVAEAGEESASGRLVAQAAPGTGGGGPSFTVSGPTLLREGTRGSYTIGVAGGAPGDFPVAASVSIVEGTADSGDYESTRLPITRRYSLSRRESLFRINTKWDDAEEDAETLTLVVHASGAEGSASPDGGSLVVTIQDATGDDVTVEFASAGGTVSEPDPSADLLDHWAGGRWQHLHAIRVLVSRRGSDPSFRIRRAGIPLRANVFTNRRVWGLTAEGMATFHSGTRIPTPDPDVKVLGSEFVALAEVSDDRVAEDDGVVEFVIGALPEGFVKGAVATYTLTVLDNDMASTVVGLSADAGIVAEADGIVEIPVTASLAGTVSRADPLMLPLSFGSSRGAGFAAEGEDFSVVGPAAIIIPGWEMAGVGTVTLSIADDSAVEATETIVASSPAAGLDATPFSLQVADNDTATVEFGWSPPPGGAVAEGLSAEFEFRLDSDVASGIRVPWTVVAEGDATAGDFASVTGTLTIGSGSASSAGASTLSVGIAEDDILEGAETAQLAVGPLEVVDSDLSPRVFLGGPESVAFTIARDHPGRTTVRLFMPVVSGHVLDDGSIMPYADVAEGEAATFTLALIGRTGTEEISVPITVGEPEGLHTAQDADFVPLSSPVVIPAGVREFEFDLTTRADGIADAGEVVAIVAGEPTGGSSGAGGVALYPPGAALVTIVEPNAKPAFASRTASFVAEENDAAVGRVPLAADEDGDAVAHRLVDDASDPGEDSDLFGIDPSTGLITVAAGRRLDESRPRLTVTVEALDGKDARGLTDSVADDTLTVDISVTDVDEPPGAPQNLSASAPASGAGTELSVGWDESENTGPPLRYEIRYREAGAAAFTGEGDAGYDVYRAAGGTSATVGSLSPGTEHEIEVRATNDEGSSEWARARARTGGAQEPSASPPALPVPPAAVAPPALFRESNTISYDSDSDLRISEDDARASLVLFVDVHVAGAHPVDIYSVVPHLLYRASLPLGLSGSARYGEDYHLGGSWPLVRLDPVFGWFEGLTIIPIRDGVREGDEHIVIGNSLPGFVTEYLTVTLSDGEGRSLAGFGPAPGMVEEGEAAEFPVTLSAPLHADVSIPWRADPAGDLEPGSASGTVAFAAGAQTATISVGVADDGLREPIGVLTVSLGSPVSDLGGRVGIGEVGVAHAFVRSADPVTVGLAPPGSAVVLEGGSVEIPITLSSPIGRPATLPSGLAEPGPTLTLDVFAAVAGTAEKNTDFRLSTPHHTFDGAVPAEPATVTVTALEDGVSDPGETILLSVQAVGRDAAGSGRLLTLTVTDPTNRPPAFPGAAPVRAVARDAAAGAAVGAPVTARDPDGDPLSYRLDGSAFFGIDGAGGQVTVAGALAASPAAHTLTVAVSDGRDGFGNPDPAVDDRATVLVSVSESAVVGVSISGPSRVRDGVRGLVDEGEAAQFEVALSESRTRAVHVPWAAAPAEDVSPGSRSGTLVFAPGETSKRIAVTLLEDGLDEPWEAVEVALGTPSENPSDVGPADGSAGSAHALVRSADPVSASLVAPQSPYLAEGSDFTARFELSAPVEQFRVAPGVSLRDDVTLGATLGGTAVPGQDVALASDAVTLAAGSGARSGSFTVVALEDGEADVGETVVLGVSAHGRPGVVAGPAGITLTVTEPNAAPVLAGAGVTLTRAVAANSAGGSPVGEPVAASDEDSESLAYTLEGSGLFGIDRGSGQITVAPGARFAIGSQPAQVTVPGANVVLGSGPALARGVHTVTVAVSDGRDEHGWPDPSSDASVPVVISVTDGSDAGHPPVTASFVYRRLDHTDFRTRTYHQAVEGGRPAEVEVALDVRPQREISVPIVVLSGRASFSDHRGVPRSVTFGPDDLTVTFSVTAVDDTEPEADEDLVVGLGNPLPAGVTAGAAATASLDLKDNDSNRIVFSTFDSTRITETVDPPPIYLRVSVWRGESQSQVGSFANLLFDATRPLGLSGTAKHGVDYVLDPLSPPIVSLTPGFEWIGILRILPIRDNIPEGDEHIVIGNSVRGFFTEYLTVTLSDGQSPSLIGYGPVAAEVREGDTAVFPLTMSAPVGEDVTVPWWANDAGELDPGSSSGTVTFAAGARRATISVGVADDGLQEPWELLEVTLGDPTPGLGGQVRTEDDKVARMLIVSADPVVAGFGDPDALVIPEGRTAEIPVTLSAPIGPPVTLPIGEGGLNPNVSVLVFAVDSGSADLDRDFVMLNLAVTVTDGAAVTPGTVTVSMRADDEAEGAETVVLAVSAAGRGVASSGERLTLTVVDNANGAPAFAGAEPGLAREVAENSPGGTAVGDPVTAADPEGDPLTYTLEGSALFGIDPGSGQVTVAPGALLDHESAAEHTVTAGVSDGRSAGWGDDPAVDSRVEVTVSVTDVEEESVSIADAAGVADEGGTAELPVLLSAPLSQPVAVPWAVTDPSEFAPGSDAGTVTFAPGSVAEAVRVTLLDDGLAEPWELLTVSLGIPSAEGGATVTVGGAGAGHVLANSADPLNVGLEGPAGSRITEGREAVLRVVLPSPLAAFGPGADALGTPADVTVSLSAGGSATPGTDFALFPDAVTVTAGDASPPGAVTVSVLEDGVSDAGETIVVDFTVEGRGGVGASGSGVTLTVAEHNRPPFFPASGGGYVSIIENSGEGALVGDPVAAVDLDGDSLTYSLEAPGEFGIDAASGQISVAPGGTLDYEIQRRHTVTVGVSDGVDRWGEADPSVDARTPVRISVTNEQWEHPDVIGAASARAWDGSPTAIYVHWSFRPGYDGNPPVTIYIQHRRRGTGPYLDGGVIYDQAAQTAIVTGLELRTKYDLRMRALAGDEGGDWVNLRSGTQNSFGIRQASRSVVPEGEVAGVVVTVQEPLAEALTVRYSLVDGSATGAGGAPGVAAAGGVARGAAEPEPRDFTDLGGGEVVIPAGGLGATISVALEDDEVPERSEVFGVRIDGASVGGGGEAPPVGRSGETVVTIAASDAVVLSLEGPSSPDLAEGGSAELTVLVTGEPARAPLTVGLSAESGAAAAAPGISVPGSVVVPRGAGSATLTVRALEDGIPDSGEAVRIRLQAGQGGDAPFLTESSAVEFTVTEPNEPPSFLLRGAVTVTVQEGDVPVGTPALATDPEGDLLAYSLAGGAAPGPFAIDAASGRVSFAGGAAADHETASRHSLTVQASDGKDARGIPDSAPDAHATLVVEVADSAEPPPSPTGVSAAPDGAEGHRRLSVSWADGEGTGPRILGHEIEAVSDAGDAVRELVLAGSDTAIGGLRPGAEHTVRVRAVNDEGRSGWSAPAVARTGPGIVIGMRDARLQVREGEAATVRIGSTLPASGVTAHYRLRHADTSAADLAGASRAGSVAFGAGSTSATVGLPAVDDGIPEGPEVLAVVLTRVEDAAGRAVLGEETETLVTIAASGPALTLTGPAGGRIVRGSPAVLTVASVGDPLASAVTASLLGSRSLFSHGLSADSVALGPGTQEGTVTLSVDPGARPGSPANIALGADVPGIGLGAPLALTVVEMNDQPSFPESAAAASTVLVAEDIPPGSAIGGALAAIDENDAPSYSLAGGGGLFEVDAGGQLRLAKGAFLDHETARAHRVVVEASDRKNDLGLPDTAVDARAVVTVMVDDVAEPPPAPTGLSVGASPVRGDTRLAVSWDAPAGPGLPRITGYDVEHRVKGGGPWSSRNVSRDGAAAVIHGLARETEHEVRVRARNDEDAVGGEVVAQWSPPATGATRGGLDARVALRAEGSDGRFGHTDALLVFYSLRFGNFLRANERLLGLVYGRLMAGVPTTARQHRDIIARSEEFASMAGHSEFDMDRDGVFDHADALLIFYSLRFGDFLLANERLLRLVYGRVTSGRLASLREMREVIARSEALRQGDG